jgi:hypothetical protein
MKWSKASKKMNFNNNPEAIDKITISNLEIDLERRASVKYPIAPCIQSDGSVQ